MKKRVEYAISNGGKSENINCGKSNLYYNIVQKIKKANFRGQRGWATMYGKKILNSNMYIKGAIV